MEKPMYMKPEHDVLPLSQDKAIGTEAQRVFTTYAQRCRELDAAREALTLAQERFEEAGKDVVVFINATIRSSSLEPP